MFNFTRGQQKPIFAQNHCIWILSGKSESLLNAKIS